MFPARSLVAGRLRVIASRELAREILHAPLEQYAAGAANSRILPLLPENTLLTLDGPPHLRRRRELSPLLGHGRLQATVGTIDSIVSQELDTWSPELPFPVLPRLRRLTLRIATAVIIGEIDGAEFGLLERGLDAALKPYGMLSGSSALRMLGPASPQAASARGRERFAAHLARLAADRVPPISSDELLALLLAGQDTTATAIAWALLELARDPLSVRAMLDQSGQLDEAWLDAVVHETLRLHPPLIDIVRQPREPVELGGEVVPPGALLMICPALVGHARIQNPQRFDPARMLGRRPDPDGWIPFGGGARRCLGAPLALTELKVVLRQVLQRFVIKPARPALEQARLRGTAVVPVHGGELVLTRRARSR